MVKSSNKFFNKINKLVNKIKLTNTVSEVIMSLPEIQVLKLNQHIINSRRHCSRGHAASVMNGNGDLSRGLNEGGSRMISSCPSIFYCVRAAEDHLESR